MSLSLSGIGVSRGIAIGRTHVVVRGSIEVLESAVPADLLEDEITRFLDAVDMARQQLKAIRDNIPADTSLNIELFIDTHLLMLDDATLVDVPIQIMRSQGCNAEWALKLQRDAVVDVFEQMDDAYLRTRKDDIDHVINRIQRILLETGSEDACRRRQSGRRHRACGRPDTGRDRIAGAPGHRRLRHRVRWSVIAHGNPVAQHANPGRGRRAWHPVLGT